jgi:hypothetical protein
MKHNAPKNRILMRDSKVALVLTASEGKKIKKRVCVSVGGENWIGE